MRSGLEPSAAAPRPPGPWAASLLYGPLPLRGGILAVIPFPWQTYTFRGTSLPPALSGGSSPGPPGSSHDFQIEHVSPTPGD